MNLKLNVILAKTDHLASSFKKTFEDFTKFFKTSQGAFKGERKTYEVRPGMIDLPSERSNKLVVTTVDEKLEWLENNSKDYVDNLFAQEKTNSSGAANAPLTVEGRVIGTFTSLELLRLKSLLESGHIVGMYENIPVRNDDEEWAKTEAEMYSGREIYESNKQQGVRKATTKESYILPDPNLASLKDGKSYTPIVASKDTVIEVGEFSFQRFSGEWSHRQRAEVLRRRTILVTAVVEALKVANEVEIVPSGLTSELIFGYLHRGNI